MDVNKDITKSSAKDILRDNESTATACMYAMDKLAFWWMNGEPESLWIELSRQGVSVPLENRSQLLAGRSLITTGRFWYDAIVFEKTAIAFNNEDPNYDALDDAPVNYLAWAVREADTIHKAYEDEILELDREPVEYTAVQLYREGFVLAPSSLSFAQAALDKKYPKDTRELKDKVIKEWAAAPKNKLLDAAYPETPVGVQLAKLASVQCYYDERKARLMKDLARLRGLRPE